MPQLGEVGFRTKTVTTRTPTAPITDVVGVVGVMDIVGVPVVMDVVGGGFRSAKRILYY